MNQPRPDNAWLEHRFSLFERFCLPSVAQQREQKFRWVVFFDTATPHHFLRYIEKYKCQLPTFEPVFVASFDMNVICNVIQGLVDSRNEYILSTRLDNDDAIARNYTYIVQKLARDEKGSKVFISFPCGYAHCGEGIYYTEYLGNPFFSILELRNEVSTGYSYNHHQIAKYGLVREVNNYRGWMQVIHERNHANVPPRLARPVRKRSLQGEFPPSCIGKPDRVLKWTKDYVLHHSRRYIGPLKRAVKKAFVGLRTAVRS
jgi:hypothetical protein